MIRPSQTQTAAVARKLIKTRQNWATQMPPELAKDQAMNTATPRTSQIRQPCERTSVRRFGCIIVMSGLRANAAVSHSNTKMSANGFQVCVANSAPSSHGNAARKC